MVSALQDGDFDCPICYSPLSDTIITYCGHIFCKNCILKALNRKNPCCPMCRYRLSKSDLFSAPAEEPCHDDTNKIMIPSSQGSDGTIAYSSKVSALLKLLMASRDKNPSTKSVVLSEFRKMLTLLVEPLKAAGFGVLTLEGLMKARRREDVIKEFTKIDTNSPATVLLADLKASESGIDLTVVSRVYLLEPWLNPEVEKQVLDQVVPRLEQAEDLKIVRLITRHSIEERILELHEIRRRNLDFGKNLNKRQIRNEELRIIMSL